MGADVEVAEVNTRLENWQANAALLATAPELLAACQHWVAEHEPPNQMAPDHAHGCYCGYCMARAAMAKATNIAPERRDAL